MDVLRWLRSSRISRREAAHLLDRSPIGDEHPGLADLLAAATAPARSDEVAGERAAVAAFRREYRPADTGTAPAPGTVPAAGVAAGSATGRRGSTARRPATHRPGPRRLPGRGVVVAALATVVALVGGTAYAAGSGRLPDPVQRQLHEALAGVGVPPPDPRDTPTRTLVSASPVPSGSSPADVRLLGLCRAWQAARAAPGAPQPRPDDKRALVEAAGGANRIEAFCAALVATAPGATPSSSAPAGPAPVTTTPGRPGNQNPGGPPATPPGQEKKDKGK
ncbi:hypothetical protein [Virgisporangium aurantiacum]|uniref:Uncharacterized protein n=1 Tax=Virgisporangium aurantiacum TaxID=175570 RepID=A0A8J4E0B4_9ACTN|nr:hypothetical protein [Virgisporangium aurantiacum]GIJ54852.1 hypothetical protein Vau01_023680 [Virgisporangium aurantiacum]